MTTERLSAALADRYRLERELGQGGMATVYLAEDIKHQRNVAVKVLKPELGAVLGAERFINEIRTTANLQHPNLLPLFDSGEADGFLFYVMPYVEGQTLRAKLDAERQLPLGETARLIALLVGALDFAHARGVVHRDLKPENILLQAGQPIIADFGIALAVAQAGGERVTQTGLSLGTPHYMSPEQAAGTQTVDARSDQYALGATAYEMLTGEPPHTGPTTPVIVARLMTETPRDIRATRPAVPASVDTAIQRALAKSPADRFSSCGSFADALAAGAQDTGAPAARGASAATPDRAPTSRAPVGRRVAAIGGVFALGAVVIAGAVLFRREPSSAPSDVSVRDSTTGGDTAAASERSLVVLPFTSVGGDTANSYFAAGIADELSSALTQIPGLRLAGRASAARVKQQGGGAREIGTALKVAAVLDGSVRRSGDRIRVSAELTSARDERVLWSQTYERALADVFAVQDEITREIVSALQMRLTSTSGARAMSVRGGTTNLEAYDFYLRAMPLYKGAAPVCSRRSSTCSRRSRATRIMHAHTRCSHRRCSRNRTLSPSSRVTSRNAGGPLQCEQLLLMIRWRMGIRRSRTRIPKQTSGARRGASTSARLLSTPSLWKHATEWENCFIEWASRGKRSATSKQRIDWIRCMRRTTPIAVSPWR